MSRVRLVGALDPNFAWDGSELLRDSDVQAGAKLPYDLRGAAAFVHGGEGERWRVLRDPLGLNKLFWAWDADGTVVIAVRPKRLIEEGHTFEQIRALPRGCLVDLLPNEAETKAYSIV